MHRGVASGFGRWPNKRSITHILWERLLWRGGLPPFGGETVVKSENAVFLKLLR